MRAAMIFLAAVFLAVMPLQAQAATGPEEAAIRHLIEFVRDSNMHFIRNGRTYDSPAAADHLALKYRVVHARLTTAEQFIDLIAARSAETGLPYRVRTWDGREIPTANWLREELKKYRNR